MNWKDLRYLQSGNPRQQYAYAVLQALQIPATLRDFDPVLTGTIPLAIDTADSDLDVICEVAPGAQPRFRHVLREHYGHWPTFRLVGAAIGGHDSVVCEFRYDGRVVEIFGQNLPTARQNAFRHLVVEHALLGAGGEAWRRAVQALKRAGWKTEPAFATLLQLPGDPYEALLALEARSPAELAALLAQHPLSAAGG